MNCLCEGKILLERTYFPPLILSRRRKNIGSQGLYNNFFWSLSALKIYIILECDYDIQTVKYGKITLQL